MRVRNLVLGSLLLALAGCGGPTGDDDQVASAGEPGSSAPAAEELSPEQAVLAYADCMRENGVPDFPDPEIGESGEVNMSLGEGVDPAAVEAADRTCGKHLPSGGEPRAQDPEDIAKRRAFAKCMRENGLPKFPDPSPEGTTTIEGGLGLDPTSEEFRAAEEKCRVHLPDGGRGSSHSSSQEGGR